MLHSSRRQFLKTSVGVTGLSLIGPSAVVQAFSQTHSFGEHEYPSNRLMPFPLRSVRLSPGIFKDQEDINARYLDSLSVDRLLHSFRLTADINSNVAPYGGWEEPTCELRGHFAGGHYLSAVALNFASTGDTDLKSRGDQHIAGLDACQKKIGTRYLSAFPTELFEHLAQGKPVWAPFYTYHKIMAGLLDMYEHSGNTDALRICEGMAQWAQEFMWNFSDDQRQRMLRTEYGGMNEVLANLAAVTKKERYLDAAHIFEQPGFLDPLAARRDELTGLHANTHVPKIIGAARMYEITGDHRYRDIAEYFLSEVLAARTYAIGNTSVDEHWTTPADQLKGTLEWTNAECCVAYNLMKLERHVFGWTADARWMDAYERTLFNCRLGTQNADGLKQYFFPLAAGYWRAYNSPDSSFWCCTGTGVEEFAKFADTIYFRRGKDIYVNQFIPSTLTWKEEDLTLEQTTKFPHEQGTTLTIKTSRPAERSIYVRIPGWTTEAAAIKINGRPLEAMASPGSYLALRKAWHDGDTINLSLPMQLTTEPLPGDNSVITALYGPLVLAADLGEGPAADSSLRTVHGRSTVPKDLPGPVPLPNASADTSAAPKDWLQVDSPSELLFTASGA
ncbi:MAG TPA: beta-L-arabinofuranosidase domain-containing protein, partial [Terracidiphilus sp.]|nr:beta-L-arabinofuranosidase domain-containing protein [Terracidiphilus sp.]